MILRVVSSSPVLGSVLGMERIRKRKMQASGIYRLALNLLFRSSLGFRFTSPEVSLSQIHAYLRSSRSNTGGRECFLKALCCCHEIHQERRGASEDLGPMLQLREDRVRSHLRLCPQPVPETSLSVARAEPRRKMLCLTQDSFFSHCF